MNDSTTEQPKVKRCSKCGFECAFEDVAQFFYRAGKKRGDGFMYTCKTCVNARLAIYRECNREKLREYDKRSYQKHRDKRTQKKRDLYANDPEIRDRIRRWGIENPDRKIAHSKKYRANNPDRVLLNGLRRKSRLSNVEFNWTTEDKRRAVEYFNHACAYCQSQTRDLFGEITLHFDHYIPLLRGGSTTPDNMIPTCSRCNKSKHASPPVEWMQKKFGKRKAREIQTRIEKYFAVIKDRQG